MNILDNYEILSVLGEGTFGVVKLGKVKATGEIVAIKILEKKRIITKDDEKRVSYKCEKCNVSGYYEEAAFVYLYNKVNSTNFKSLADISKIEKITNKEQYRSLELVMEK